MLLIGLTREETDVVGDYLAAQGRIKYETLGAGISITPVGVQDVEREMAAENQQSLAPRIPSPVIAEISRAFDAVYTHAQIDNVFMRTGAPGAAPRGIETTQGGCLATTGSTPTRKLMHSTSLDAS